MNSPPFASSKSVINPYMKPRVESLYSDLLPYQMISLLKERTI